MTATRRAFVPAAGEDRWLAFYDPLTKLLGTSAAHRTLIDQARLETGHRVLDIGCGTGTLAVALKARHPNVEVVALDPDDHALTRARQKAERAGVAIEFVQGFGDGIPRPEGAFDRVLSSFMLHHLTSAEKAATLADVRRVLKPGGTFHLLDFAAAEDESYGLIARLLHHGEHLRDNANARVLAMLAEAGLENGQRLAVRRTWLGPIAFHRAERGKGAM